MSSSSLCCRSRLQIALHEPISVHKKTTMSNMRNRKIYLGNQNYQSKLKLHKQQKLRYLNITFRFNKRFKWCSSKQKYFYFVRGPFDNKKSIWESGWWQGQATKFLHYNSEGTNVAPNFNWGLIKLTLVNERFANTLSPGDSIVTKHGKESKFLCTLED